MKQADILQLLQSRRFDAGQEPPKEEIVFRVDWQTIGSLGDYSLITGRPKAGKTKYLAGAMAAAISRKEVFGLKIKLPDHKRRVVHFDTEQGRRSHYNLLQLVSSLSEMPPPDYFDSYHCRQDSADKILLMIEYYLKNYPDTGMLYIDGLLDLIANFNDVGDSKRLVDWLKRITESNNVHVTAIVHRSMSVDKSIGHLGSTLDRAAQSVLIVEKVKETKQYILKAEYLRDGDEFTPRAIYYNKDLEIWQQTDYIDGTNADTGPRGRTSQLLKRKPADYDLAQHMNNVGQMFNIKDTLTWEELKQQIREVYNVGRDWAGECVKHLVSLNLIWKVENGYTNIRQAKLFIQK
jgi:hypothetical protein